MIEFITFEFMSSQNINIKNKKARFEYEIIDEFVAGIRLLGTEIKSIRESKASIAEAFAVIQQNEVFLRNAYIEEYSNGGHFNHEVRRDRKLLLNRAEITKIHKKLKTKGFTLVPLNLFVNDKGLAKVRIGLAKGKKIHDKRDSIKDRDSKRALDRIKKNFG